MKDDKYKFLNQNNNINISNLNEREKSKPFQRNISNNNQNQILSNNSSPTKQRSNANEENEAKDPYYLENKTIYQKMKIHNNTKFNIGNNNNNQNEKKEGKQADKNNRKSSLEENNLDSSEGKCSKCSSIRDSYKKAVSVVNNYVDCINERLNSLYHKITPQKKTNISGSIEMDFSISPEFYHTLYYSEIEKFKLNSDVSFQLRSLMKSLTSSIGIWMSRSCIGNRSLS